MKDQALTCFQINLQHSKIATNNLVQLIYELRIDLCLIQEPYTVNNKLAGIPKSMRTYVCGAGRKRAAIIISNKNIDATVINQLSNEDCVVVEIHHRDKKFYTTSMYFDIEADISIDIGKIESILEHTKGEGMLISADTNARSKLWFDTTDNDRGRDLEEFLTTSTLHIINENTGIPTFETRRAKSWIDLTITNNTLLKRITNWKCGEEESCSDHKIISFQIRRTPQTSIRINQPEKEETLTGTRYIVKKEENYELFNNILHSALTKEFQCDANETNLKETDNRICKIINLPNDAETVAERFNSCIIAACDGAFHKSTSRKISTKGKSVPWWNDQLTVLRKRVNALRRRYQRTINNQQLREERKNQYNEGKREYQLQMQKEKLTSWKKYCTIEDGSNPWHVAYKLAAGKIRTQPSLTTIRKTDGTYTADTEETLMYMIDHFTPDDNTDSDTEKQQEMRRQQEEPLNTPKDKEFTQEEIFQVIRKFDSKKAPGEDGITSNIILSVFKIFPSSVTAIYNNCLRHACFPKIWKISQIIPIVKPGMEESHEVTKFRPISLLNIEGKILEKLMIERINHHIHTKNLFSMNQYGFIPQKSTIDAALEVKKFIKNNLDQKNSVIITSLDVKGAFDAAWWPGILHNLRNLQCPSNLYYLVKNYFRNRIAKLTMNHNRTEKEVMKGCPQGSCCGPGLWNILYNSLLSLRYTKQSKLVAFADDLVLMTAGETKQVAEMYANTDLKQIEDWSKQYKLQFNNGKSKTLLISRKRKEEKSSISVYINNRIIEQVQQLKYLGILFDNKLKFDKHIKQVSEKCIKLINALAKSAKLNWGLGTQALRTIYKGAILPMLLYGVQVWGEAILKTMNMLKYQRVQRLINIKITKAYRTVSYEASCVLAAVKPINIKIQEILEVYKATHIITTKETPSLLEEPPKLSEWPHPADRISIQVAQETKRYDTEIYTDGSKINGKVGAAAVIFQNGQAVKKLKYKLGIDCSNNQAEQIAILQALIEIKANRELEVGEKQVLVNTDSQITVELLKNSQIRNKIIEEIKNETKHLQENGWTIHVKWVKAHVGLRGNELADALAKEAAQDDNLDIIYNKIPKTHIIREAEEKGLRRWQTQWETTTKGTISKMFFPSVQERLKQRIPLNGQITAFLTGHGKTRDYYNRFRIVDSALCKCEKQNQTVNHLIYECTLLNRERQTLKQGIRQKGGHWPATNQDLVKIYLKEFIKFINKIDFEKL